MNDQNIDRKCRSRGNVTVRKQRLPPRLRKHIGLLSQQTEDHFMPEAKGDSALMGDFRR